ncbi:hypothetical protein [Pontivivens ytuae]|uniref:Uncharacterized protein n=1 Tax=Pontivivens ytuae TaxID=2789856 RepID=A0A7S9LQ73_9RHOB|nr:hypothetical protein [Pontivivens ytuae]QPH53274.1 hypothetical protein I0K15_15990 [Pontivivens ytuae]
MAPLALLLTVKIVVTLVGVVGPFLLLRRARIDALIGATAGSPLIYRLYGIAILALLFGYGGGLVQIAGGQFPSGVVVMGIVSNGGAALVLARVPRFRSAAVALGLLTAALGLALLAPEVAMGHPPG